MARAIDAEKYMELLKEQYLHNKSMGNSQAARAWQGAMQLLYDMPTLTPPNEWVSVEDRLPKYNIREDGELISSKILCYCETDKTVHLVVSQKFYTGRKGEIVHPVFRYYDEWGDEIENVSHWMPLPERPKEDE